MTPTRESDGKEESDPLQMLIEEARMNARRRRFLVVSVSLVTVFAIIGVSITMTSGSAPGKNGAKTTAPASPSALARDLCQTSLGAQALNSAPGTVAEVRSTFVVAPSPSGKLEFPNAFPGARGNQIIGWCWTGKPQLYELYAVASHFKPMRVEGLGGAYILKTPEPGPAPIP
jgi:hypothetical protein